MNTENFRWQLGDKVRKKRGSQWRGTVCGFYSTPHTPEGYCVDSAFEPGSVQVWPLAALEDWDGTDRIETLEAENERLELRWYSLNKANNARITALIAAGDKLNELACHQDDCEIVTHGIWSDPIPCTCGYTKAWAAWQALAGKAEQ